MSESARPSIAFQKLRKQPIPVVRCRMRLDHQVRVRTTRDVFVHVQGVSPVGGKGLGIISSSNESPIDRARF